MYRWGGIVAQVRRAALTACAASFFAVIAFLIIRSPEFQAPTPYQGLWLSLPAVDEGGVSLAGDEFGEPPSGRGVKGATEGAVDGRELVARAGTVMTPTGRALNEELALVSGRESVDLSEAAAARLMDNHSVRSTGRRLFQTDGDLFAINLESTVRPADPSNAVVLPGLEGLRLYVTRFEKDGKTWHRLRLGFFRSQEMARQALADLRSDYLDAWVARVSAREVFASTATAVYESPKSIDGSGLSAKAVPVQPQEHRNAWAFRPDLTVPTRIFETGVTADNLEAEQNAQTTSTQVALVATGFKRETTYYNFSSDLSGAPSPEFRFRGSGYKASSGELALLQRWGYDVGTLEPNSPDFAFEGQDGRVGYFFGLEGNGTVHRPGLEPQLNAGNEWNQSLAMRGDLSWSKLAKVQFRNRLIEQRDEEEHYIGDFLINRDSEAWRQNRINSSVLTLGLADGRLTSDTMINTSRYTDSDLDDEYVTGHQLVHKMNLDIWRGEVTRFSAFGIYGEVDKDYNDFSLDEEEDKKKKKKKKKDPFSEPGQAATRLGGQLGLGPADFTLAQTDSWDAEDSQGVQKTEYTTSLGLDLNRLKDLMGGTLGESFWHIAPDYIYVGYGIGAVDVGSGSATEDRTTDINAGASWNWGNGYSYLSYWHSNYDSRQPGAEDYDWAGDGLDLGGGMWGNRWNFDLSVYMSRSEQMGEWSQATDLSLGGSLSMTYKPDELPDLSVSLGSDRYRGDYIAWNGTSESEAWIFTSQLDFAKYWEDLWGPQPANFGMVFQLKNDSSFEKWGGQSDRESDTDYFIGFQVGVGLGE